MKCPNCSKKGHTIKYCPFIEKCKFCEKVGHTEERCYFNPKNKIPKCDNCNKYGHINTECYYIDTEKKNAILKKQKEMKEQKEKEEKERQERSDEFANKGFTYTEKTLKFYKQLIDNGQIPWEVYDFDEPMIHINGLTKKEKKRLKQIKYEISKL